MSNAKGVRELERYRKDFEPLSRKDAIYAFCCDCMGGFEDSIRDCDNPRCPLYPYQQYSKKKVKKVI